jgi:hypothetical protein
MRWCQSTIIDVQKEAGQDDFLVLVYFIGFKSSDEEWLPSSSPRLAPFNTQSNGFTGGRVFAHSPWKSDPRIDAFYTWDEDDDPHATIINRPGYVTTL